MQRLFSTFPGSWPGLGLLLLRMTVIAMTLLATFTPEGEPSAMSAPTQPSWIMLTVGLATIGLVLGLATPLASALVLVGVVVLGHDVTLSSRLILGGASLSLMMLGPGAWSLDSRLYGRKRIRFDGE